MYYRVTGFEGDLVSGFDDLPPPGRAQLPARRPSTQRWSTSTTTAIATSRCAWLCCCSPWPAATGRGMAVVQVAETLELRRTLARQILVDTLWRQAAAGEH